MESEAEDLEGYLFQIVAHVSDALVGEGYCFVTCSHVEILLQPDQSPYYESESP